MSEYSCENILKKFESVQKNIEDFNDGVREVQNDKSTVRKNFEKIQENYREIKKVLEFINNFFENELSVDGKLDLILGKLENGLDLRVSELTFIYELWGRMFNHDKKNDPRIAKIRKLRKLRDVKKDAPIVLGCKPEEIAWGPNEIKALSNVYIGRLYSDTFKHKFEKVFVQFPEQELEFFYTTGEGSGKPDAIYQQILDEEIDSEDEDDVGIESYVRQARDEVVRKRCLVIINFADLEFEKEVRNIDGWVIGAKVKNLGLSRCSFYDAKELIVKKPFDQDDSINILLDFRANESRDLGVVIGRNSRGRFMGNIEDIPSIEINPQTQFAFRLPEVWNK